MFWSGKVKCGVCHVAVPKAQAPRALERGVASVCDTCYERWTTSGRICVKCQRPVYRFQPAGFFMDRRALGHADCGGTRLAA
jgi:hypothetical protein